MSFVLSEVMLSVIMQSVVILSEDKFNRRKVHFLNSCGRGDDQANVTWPNDNWSKAGDPY